MKPLASRKQLLIAESELNREQLLQEWQAMTDDVHALARQARTIGSFASAAASLVAGVASYRRKRSAPPAGKPSWWQTLLSGAQLAGSFWSEFRAQPKNPPDISDED
jgi:HPt (histidine-containing phosphotransfer) domain-containing protein